MKKIENSYILLNMTIKTNISLDTDNHSYLCYDFIYGKNGQRICYFRDNYWCDSFYNENLFDIQCFYFYKNCDYNYCASGFYLKGLIHYCIKKLTKIDF